MRFGVKFILRKFSTTKCQHCEGETFGEQFNNNFIQQTLVEHRLVCFRMPNCVSIGLFALIFILLIYNYN